MPRADMDNRRRELVAAASRVARRDGLAATTTRRIATEANMSLALVHYCYETKDALLRDLWRTMLERLVDLAAINAGMDDDPVGQVRDLILATVRTGEADPGAVQLIVEMKHWLLRHPEHADLTEWGTELVSAFYLRKLESLRVRPRVPTDLRALAETLRVVHDGVLSVWFGDRDTEAAARVATVVANSLFVPAEG